MLKKSGTVALLLGAFLLALATLSKFYMYDQLAVAPQNTISTSVSETAPGAEAEYLDAAAGLKVTTGPLKSTRTVVGDVKASKQASKDLGKGIAVYKTYSCTDIPTFDCKQGSTPLSGTDDTVAFDRSTGEAVAWKGTKHAADGKTTQPYDFQGLYFKFPFDTQKTTYQFWDDTLAKATSAKYVGEGKVQGLKVYKFRQTIAPTNTGTIDVPGSLVGSTESTVTADQMYSNVVSFSVEPTTGVIVVGGAQQDSWLEVNGVRKVTTTKAALEYTAANTANTVSEYKSKAAQLAAIKTTVPLFGGVLGALLILFGVWTRRGSSESSAPSHRPERSKVTTGS